MDSNVMKVRHLKAAEESAAAYERLAEKYEALENQHRVMLTEIKAKVESVEKLLLQMRRELGIKV